MCHEYIKEAKLLLYKVDAYMRHLGNAHLCEVVC